MLTLPFGFPVLLWIYFDAYYSISKKFRMEIRACLNQLSSVGSHVGHFQDNKYSSPVISALRFLWLSYQFYCSQTNIWTQTVKLKIFFFCFVKWRTLQREKSPENLQSMSSVERTDLTSSLDSRASVAALQWPGLPSGVREVWEANRARLSLRGQQNKVELTTQQITSTFDKHEFFLVINLHKNISVSGNIVFLKP